MFYTYCERKGNKIFHCYFDKKKHKEVVTNFPIELYEKGKGNHKSLYNDSLKQYSFNSISDAQDFIHKNEDNLYGQTNLVYQFLSYKYPQQIDFDFSKIKILVLDIETAYDDSGFPSAQKANHPIISISCKLLNDPNAIVFGMKEIDKNENFNYVLCEDEKSLLSSFQDYWNSIQPDIITGWNIVSFDIPYIVNRCNQILGEEFTNNFSPFSSKENKCIIPYQKREFKEQFTSYKILGINIMDYLNVYKKYSLKILESYSLDSVANFELNRGKVDYSEYNGLMGLYEENPNLFYYYNYIDIKIVEELENKLNFLFLAATLTYIGKSKYEDIFGTIKWWDTYIYNYLLKDNIQIPPDRRNAEKLDIVGGFVKEPVPKLYKWIVTLDLTSLYPSIIMSFNLSPETIKSNAKYTLEYLENFIDMNDNLDSLKKDNQCMLANGATFDKAKQGILPFLVNEMFISRKKYKNEMLAKTNELEELKKQNIKNEELENLVTMLSAKQQAFKIALNALYGALANPHFRYNSRIISEGITMTGQLIIKYISKQINEEMNRILKTKDEDYIIANDTDSAMLNMEGIVKKANLEDSDINRIVNFLDKVIETHFIPYIKNRFQKLADYLNVYENRLNMDREVISDRGLWRGKKNYILQMYDKEGVRFSKPKLKMMGIETARSSVPKIAREALEKSLVIILNRDEKTLQAFVKEFKNIFMNTHISELASPRGVSDIKKWIENGELKKGTPIHTRAAIIFNQLIDKYKISEYPAIKNGDKIKFIYLKEPNHIHSHVIGFIDDLPKEFGLDNYIDKQKQFEKVFLDPLKSFTDIIGWAPEKIISLSSFFD